MKEVLAELKSIYLLYSRLWTQWTALRQCRLSAEEIYTVEVHVSNNFQYDVEDSVMFYNKENLLRQLTQKLRERYESFKAWVLEGFKGALVWRGIKQKGYLFFTTPIIDLSVSNELKIALLRFNCITVKDIINLEQEDEYKTKEKFDLVIDCELILFKEERQILSRKEVQEN